VKEGTFGLHPWSPRLIFRVTKNCTTQKKAKTETDTPVTPQDPNSALFIIVELSAFLSKYSFVFHALHLAGRGMVWTCGKEGTGEGLDYLGLRWLRGCLLACWLGGWRTGL